MKTCDESRNRRRVPIAAIVVSGVLAVVLTLNAIAPPGGNWRERALAFADLQHMFGPMQVAGQSYSGSFVKFRFNEATATITDYTVIARGRTTAVFQDMVPGIVSFGSVILNGTLFEYSSAAYSILSFNNPTSTLIVESVSATMEVNFTLSAGVDASRNGRTLNLSTPELTARLFVTGAATLTLIGYQVTAHLLPGTSALFRANSVDGESAVGASGQTILAEATVGGFLGLESFSVGFEGYVESSDVQYDGISFGGIHLTAAGFTADFQIGQPPSNLLALHAHNSVFDYDSQSSYQVKLDGADIARHPAIGDVIVDRGTLPKYAMINGENGTLFLIRIPDSGSHTLSVQRIPPQPPEPALNPIQLFAITAMVLVLLGAAATFMLRRRSA